MHAGALVRIQPIVAVTVQLSVTPLLAFTNLESFESLIFTFINDDPTNAWTATIETAEVAAGALDAEFAPSLLVPPAAGGLSGQRTLIVGPAQIRTFYRASGIATGAPVTARWGLSGMRRLFQSAHGGFR